MDRKKKYHYPYTTHNSAIMGRFSPNRQFYKRFNRIVAYGVQLLYEQFTRCDSIKTLHPRSMSRMHFYLILNRHISSQTLINNLLQGIYKQWSANHTATMIPSNREDGGNGCCLSSHSPYLGPKCYSHQLLSHYICTNKYTQLILTLFRVHCPTWGTLEIMLFVRTT